MDDKFLPLSGIKVVELATVVAAPTCTRLLAAYGADVIKIEPPSGDPLRYVGHQMSTPCEPYKDPVFTFQNSGKNFISINLKTPEGMEILMELLKDADVFVSNIRLGSRRKLGIDYESLKDKFPRLIYVGFTGFGPLGADANTPGYDITAFWMRNGPMADWTEDGGFPFMPGYGFGDIATSSSILSGILIALIGREKTGLGTEVNTSLLANGIWCNANNFLKAQFREEGITHGRYKPSNMFSTYYLCSDDRWICIVTNNYPKDKEKIAKALGMEDILSDPRYENYDTLRSSGALKEGIDRCVKIFRSNSSEYWKAHLLSFDICAAIAKNTREVADDRQAIENGYIKTVEFADDVKAVLPSPPVSFSAFSQRETVPVGDIGENTDDILKMLGYSDAEIQDLRDNKIVR